MKLIIEKESNKVVGHVVSLLEIPKFVIRKTLRPFVENDHILGKDTFGDFVIFNSENYKVEGLIE